MSLLFMDGFDHYGTTTDLGLTWNIENISFATYDATGGRFGGGSAKITLDDIHLEKIFPVASTVIVQFAVNLGNVAANDFLLSFRKSTVSTLNVKVNVGKVDIYRGTTLLASSTLEVNNTDWHYFEVKVVIHATAGSFTVRVDGVEYVSFTGNTVESSRVDTDAIRLFGIGATDTNHYDDVIIMDSAGTKNNDFIGDTRIETIYPNGDTTQKDFTATGAGTTNADRVDEGDAGPDGDTTYVEASTVGNEDHYTLGDLVTADIGLVHAVQAVTYAKKDDAGARTARQAIHSNTTTEYGASIPLTTSYAYYQDVIELDPDTSGNWTETIVNAVELGQEVET